MQGDEFELVEIQSTTPSILSKPKPKKRNNKISSPPLQFPRNQHEEGDISDLFLAKTSPTKPTKPSHIKIQSPSETISENISELSDDVFTTEKRLSVGSISQTESKSYKDRIKQRFQAIKKNAGKTQASAFKVTSKKIIMERIRRESTSVDAKYKHVLQKLELNSKDRNVKELFFTKNLDSHLEKITENDNLIEDSQENLIKDENEQLTLFHKAHYVQNEIKEALKEFCFYPTSNDINPKDKLPEDELRDLEDEGMYVKTPLNVYKRHLNLVEERLLSLEDKKWFNSEGNLEILENPIKKYSTKPIRDLDAPKNLTKFVKPKLENDECTDIVVIKENILELRLQKLKFSHHPLFSLEHVLGQRLEMHVEQLEHFKTNNTLQKIKNKLEAMRHIKSNLESAGKEGGDIVVEKTQHYTKDIKELRELYFAQSKKEKASVKTILELWKGIKTLREKNEYNNTNIKLNINKLKTNIKAEKENYNLNFEKTYQELIQECKEEHEEKLNLYNEKIKELEQTSVAHSDDDLELPKRPKFEIDEEELKQTLKSKCKECLRAPDDPNLTFSVIKLATEAEKNVANAKEIQRRSVTTSTKIYVRIVCNKLEVCKTKPIPLNNDFECVFNEKLSVLLTNVPKSIILEIYEKSNALIQRKICELTLSIPPQTSNNQKTNLLRENFEKNEIIHYKHEGVGSGKKFQSVLDERNFQVKYDNFQLITAGYLVYKMWWETNLNPDNPENTSEVCNMLDEVIDKNGTLQIKRLSKWVHDNNPDPQDPKNSIIYEYITEYNEEMASLRNKTYFRLGPQLKPLEFCPVSELDDNIRLKILQLRNQNEPEFTGMLVPNRVKEIPLNLLYDYRRRILNEIEGADIRMDDSKDMFDQKKRYGIKCLQQIHTKVFQICRNTENNLSYEDVLDEKYLDHFQKLIKISILNFLNWFRLRPQISQPLPNLKEVETEQTKQILTMTSVKIYIRLLSGINVPQRINRENSKKSKGNSPEKISEDKEDSKHKNTVSPFVEVTYNDLLFRTSIGEGVNPVWNEEILIPLESHHVDYLNPNSLKGTICLNIFDRVDIDLNGEMRKNWLGHLEIPLSAICSTNDLQTLFMVNVPNVLFGYENLTEKTASKSRTNIVDSDTYINLKLGVHPNIPKLSPSMDELPSSDLPYIRNHVLKWNEAYNNSFPKRKFSALAIDSNGKTTCVVRFIKPLEPPQLNTEGFDVSAQQCAKFVSLIQFSSSNHFYQNVWLSTEQFLDLLVGSIVDHAVCLTCFFLALRLDAWLLLGLGIPYGFAAYVLVREYSKEAELPAYYVYDVVTGRKYNVMHQNCPILSVYCIIGDDNVWANTQRTENIALTRFDLSRRSDWLPLFNQTTTAPTNSIQNKVTYTEKVNIVDLESNLERKLRKRFAKSRQFERTVWNNRLSHVVKKYLNLFEINYQHGKSPAELLNELNKSISDYEISGYILCLPFTNVLDILKKLKTYGIYTQEDCLEFSLAVKLSSYSNCVISCWIFLASVKEK